MTEADRSAGGRSRRLVSHAAYKDLLEDPDVTIRGNRVLQSRAPVRR